MAQKYFYKVNIDGCYTHVEKVENDGYFEHVPNNIDCFKTFREAKKAAIEELNYRIGMYKECIDFLRKTKKKDIKVEDKEYY